MESLKNPKAPLLPLHDGQNQAGWGLSVADLTPSPVLQQQQQQAVTGYGRASCTEHKIGRAHV